MARSLVKYAMYGRLRRGFIACFPRIRMLSIIAQLADHESHLETSETMSDDNGYGRSIASIFVVRISLHLEPVSRIVLKLCNYLALHTCVSSMVYIVN